MVSEALGRPRSLRKVSGDPRRPQEAPGGPRQAQETQQEAPGDPRIPQEANFVFGPFFGPVGKESPCQRAKNQLPAWGDFRTR